ncbi:MAG: family 20 glycosylhydrolase, partial [Candidatus Marinimicrobia bacterium]|nr:family 20 glycosylhydrolase [Candidatus Neomarinimicrobiota bacterium]
MKKIVLLLGLFFPSIMSIAQNQLVNVIPKPYHVVSEAGVFKFDESVRILAETTPGILKSAHMFADQLLKTTATSLRFDSVRYKNTRYITIFREDSARWCGPEGYHLVISGNGIEIVALTEAGIFYALQTLRQLMPAEFGQDKNLDLSTIEIPCMTISDKPRFIWRGMNFDCGRHFMEVDFIKRYIDLLAFHKMNILHWHLTEDQGWRIEIKKYPELTKVGAWRKEDDGGMYGGFYTQAQIREVVAYAAERYVTVVPEIEMPGHALAALASYPQLSCTGGPFEVEKRWGVFNDIYCAGNDSVFIFLQDVLTEVMDLFPSKYIHIGGDEAPKVRWEACPKCQARMKSENLKSEEEL